MRFRPQPPALSDIIKIVISGSSLNRVIDLSLLALLIEPSRRTKGIPTRVMHFSLITII